MLPQHLIRVCTAFIKVLPLKVPPKFGRRQHCDILIASFRTIFFSKALNSLKMKEDDKYSKTCVKWPLKKRQNKDLNDKW